MGTPGPHHNHANSGLNNYNSNNTHNTSIDANMNGTGTNWGFKPTNNGQSRNQQLIGGNQGH